MLIVIPTYKRNECLRWVLKSLVQCRVDKIPEPIRVLVVNNYPPAANEIKEIVGRFYEYKEFEWSILYRKKTLMPVDNWYSAIFDNSLPNEVVFINSDDDLFLPFSLEVRYLAITDSKAEMALGLLGPNVFFSEQGCRILCQDEIAIEKPTEISEISFETIANFSPQHLSNHCYRNTPELREAYDRAMSWCDALTWLDYNNRVLFLPLYIPLALLRMRHKVIGLTNPILLRGRDVKEVQSAPFGVPGWNHGFIHATALFVFNSKDLSNIIGLNALRESYLKSYVKWFLTYPFDKRLIWSTVIETQRAANIKWSSLLCPDLLEGLSILLKDWLGLRGFKLARLARAKSIPTAQLLESIAPAGEWKTGL